MYEVKHVELGRRAALKMLLPEIAKKEEMATRFFTEARAMSMVEHPALTHVYEYGHLDDGGAYIVMEYIEGESLRQLLHKRGGKLHVIAALSWVRQIAAALQVAHEKGVIHRDLKPENIMLVENEDTSVESRIKILDFGIAKTFDVSPEAKPIQTRPGQMMGTPTYMAPEQADAPGKIGGHTDVYALGVLLFEMISGRPPFTGDDAIEVVGKHMFSAPPHLRDVVPDADLELDELLFRMLAKAPESRPTMRELKSQLGKLAKKIGQRSSQITGEVEDPSQAETLVMRKSRPAESDVQTQFIRRRPGLRRDKTLLIAIGILIFGFLGLGIWLVLSSSPTAPALAPAKTPPEPKPAPAKARQDDPQVEAKPTAPPAQPIADEPEKTPGAKRRSGKSASQSRGAANPAPAEKQSATPQKTQPGSPRLVD